MPYSTEDLIISECYTAIESRDSKQLGEILKKVKDSELPGFIDILYEKYPILNDIENKFQDNSILHLLAKNKNFEITDTLIDKLEFLLFLDYEQEQEEALTPLFVAAENENLSAFQAFWKIKPCSGRLNDYGDILGKAITILEIVIERNYHSILDAILDGINQSEYEKSAFFLGSGYMERSPSCIAAATGNLYALQKFWEVNPDPKVHVGSKYEKEDNNILHLAQNNRVVQWIIINQTQSRLQNSPTSCVSLYDNRCTE